ncbi:hypothetical protein D910_12253 [Dendroctonus ponderosae]|uniref:Uncharacterized protein n=1 Tax=Dendroctonus ponderosae TaxID=77166 RepID=U4UXB9_DENPD|nr:hypothetical protein D910_12253 [Dendroctonus ponderosae]
MISLGSYFEQLLEFGSLTAAQFEPAFGRSQIYCILVSCAYYIHGQERGCSTPEDSNSQHNAQAPMTQATLSQTTSAQPMHKYGLRPRNRIRTV